MTGKVWVDPSAVRANASGFEDNAGRIDAVLSELRSACKAYNGSWGNDEFGEPFAKDSGSGSGYETRAADLLTTLVSKVALLGEYSKGLRDAATTFETTESNNTDSFRS